MAIQDNEYSHIYTKSEGEIVVISVDPGYDRCGIAVLSKKPGSKDKLLTSLCLETKPTSEFIDRMYTIVSGFEQVIEQYHPEFLAIETLFFSTNQKTAMRVAEVRGALLFAAKKASLLTLEMNPMSIKLAVTGDGKSDKSQMIKMIQLILGMQKKAKDDEYDAIATGIAFLSVYRKGYTQLV